MKEHLPKVKVMKPEATYLIWLDFREYGMNDEELMKFTVEKAKVGAEQRRTFRNGWRWMAAVKYRLSAKFTGRRI
jgi:cysteine-S-conjugate beta-lyase